MEINKRKLSGLMGVNKTFFLLKVYLVNSLFKFKNFLKNDLINYFIFRYIVIEVFILSVVKGTS